MRRTNSILASAVLLATVFVLLVSCAWEPEETVSGFYPYVSAELDVSSALPETHRDIVFEAIPSGDNDAPIFVLVVRPDSAGPDVVIMVDSSISSIRVEQQETDITRFDTRPFRRFGGLVQVGNLAYNTSMRRLVNAPRPDGDFRPLIGSEGAGEYYLVGLDDPSTVLLEAYDLDLLPTGVDTLQALTTFDAALTVSASAIDARMYDSGVADFVITTSAGAVWFFSYQLGAAPVGRAVQIPSSVRYDTVRRTTAGLIGIRNRDELVRINRTTGATEDTFSPAEGVNLRQEMPVVFDPSGGFYLLFDSVHGIIYKVETWW
jgi:hypothetical protein